MARECSLYRFWGHEGDLLYIGITVSPPHRFRKHRSDKKWWHEIASITIAQYPSEREALDAEARAIREERPRYNIAHNGPRAASPPKASRKRPRIFHSDYFWPPNYDLPGAVEAAAELGVDLRRMPEIEASHAAGECPEVCWLCRVSEAS